MFRIQALPPLSQHLLASRVPTINNANPLSVKQQYEEFMGEVKPGTMYDEWMFRRGVGAQLKYIMFAIEHSQWQAMQDFYLAIGFQLEFERDNSLMSLSLKNVNNDTGKAATFWDDGVSLILKVTTPTASEENHRLSNHHISIYVKFLVRLIKRLEAKGYVIRVQPQTYVDLQFAVAIDPAGLEIRFFECTEAQMDETSQVAQAWFAKFGYYTMETLSVDATAKFYEGIFSTLGKDGQESVIQSANRTGFRMVDSEEVISGLTKTQYIFLSTEYRDRYTSLCFTYKLAPPSALLPPPSLLALGFLHTPPTKPDIKEPIRKNAVPPLGPYETLQVNMKKSFGEVQTSFIEDGLFGKQLVFGDCNGVNVEMIIKDAEKFEQGVVASKNVEVKKVEKWGGEREMMM